MRTTTTSRRLPPPEPWQLATVETHCRACDERGEYRQLNRGGRRDTDESWEANRAFPCEHWRDHNDAFPRAAANRSGRARAGSVTARVIAWR